MEPRGKGFGEVTGVGACGKPPPFFFVPGQFDRVRPDHHGRFGRQDPGPVFHDDLAVQFHEDRHIEAQQPAGLRGQGTGGENEFSGFDSRSRCERYPFDPIARRFDAHNPVPYDPAAAGSHAVEHPPAERRDVKPSATADVEHGGRVFGEKGELACYRAGIRQEIGAREILFQSLRSRRYVGPALTVHAQSAAAQAGQRFRLFFQLRNAAVVTGQEHVAPPVHSESVAALPGQFLHQVDASVHEPEHGEVGPPVAIGFGTVGAGQRKGRSVIDEHDAADPTANGQVIGGGHAGDTRAADDDFRATRHGLYPLDRSGVSAGLTPESARSDRTWRRFPVCGEKPYSRRGRGRASLPGLRRLLEGVGELKDPEFVLVPPHDLQPHGQSR